MEAWKQWQWSQHRGMWQGKGVCPSTMASVLEFPWKSVRKPESRACSLQCSGSVILTLKIQRFSYHWFEDEGSRKPDSSLWLVRCIMERLSSCESFCHAVFISYWIECAEKLNCVSTLLSFLPCMWQQQWQCDSKLSLLWQMGLK